MKKVVTLSDESFPNVLACLLQQRLKIVEDNQFSKVNAIHFYTPQAALEDKIHGNMSYYAFYPNLIEGVFRTRLIQNIHIGDIYPIYQNSAAPLIFVVRTPDQGMNGAKRLGRCEFYLHRKYVDANGNMHICSPKKMEKYESVLKSCAETLRA